MPESTHPATTLVEGASVEIIKGLRSAVDRSARLARREGIKTAAQDIGVSVAVAGKGQPLVRASTQSRLSASWTVPIQKERATSANS